MKFRKTLSAGNVSTSGAYVETILDLDMGIPEGQVAEIKSIEYYMELTHNSATGAIGISTPVFLAANELGESPSVSNSIVSDFARLGIADLVEGSQVEGIHGPSGIIVPETYTDYPYLINGLTLDLVAPVSRTTPATLQQFFHSGFVVIDYSLRKITTSISAGLLTG